MLVVHHLLCLPLDLRNTLTLKSQFQEDILDTAKVVDLLMTVAIREQNHIPEPEINAEFVEEQH